MAVAEQLVLGHKTAEALCCVFMLESYARPSEALALTTSCVTAPIKGARGALAATSVVIRARDLAVPLKTGLFDVSVALDLPRQAWAGRALSRLAASRRTGERLWDFDHRSLGTNSRSLASLQLRGGWKSFVSVRRCENTP